ncbi:MAG: uracil-DNA glycosylase [Phycisphaeraceae bacterium]|nr:uracil-DNA glycosylase [Phycisphaerales bacterium]QOJ17471.1 MAG: uracil-DNA glycosylase [Phycisphaeraceae bacterium]
MAASDMSMTLRSARQELKTCLMLGVDFVPIGSETAVVAAPASAAPASPPVSDLSDKAALLAALEARHAAECPHCTTATGYKRIVFGEGNPEAALMFVGEAPGEQEDETGRPFVGRAGQKLDEIIAAMKMRRADVYIANVLKARPPGNRTPLPDEVARCGPYLVEQIRIIRPRVIVTLGGPASKLLLQTDEGITRLRGSWHVWRDGDVEIPVMPTFHPAYLLRNYTVDTRAKVWSDMQAVMAKLAERS